MAAMILGATIVVIGILIGILNGFSFSPEGLSPSEVYLLQRISKWINGAIAFAVIVMGMVTFAIGASIAELKGNRKQEKVETHQ